MNADDGHYGAHLAAEVLALRDSVQGWQSAGRPGGRPIDIDADRRLADAVTHLTAARSSPRRSDDHRQPGRWRHLRLG